VLRKFGKPENYSIKLVNLGSFIDGVLCSIGRIMRSYIADKPVNSAEGGIRTHDPRSGTGLANLRHARLGDLDSSNREWIYPI
jgi:hypothetical protein